MQKSGGVEARAVEMDAIQKEIRLAEADFIERQMEPLVDMSRSLIAGPNSRSEYAGQIVRVDGMADTAADAYAQYLETGDFTIKL